jgi:hypothetical protein
MGLVLDLLHVAGRVVDVLEQAKLLASKRLVERAGRLEQRQ